MAPRNRKKHFLMVVLSAIFLVALFGAGMLWISTRAEFASIALITPILQKVHTLGIILITLSLLSTVGLLTYLFFAHKFYKGFKYGCNHTSTYYNIQKGLRESGYYISSIAFGCEVAIVPDTSISFDDNDCVYGTVVIKTHTKFDKRLDDAPISPSLPEKYIVLNRWKADNQHYYIYEIGDWHIGNSVYSSLEAFRRRVKKTGEYQIFIDNKPSHLLTIHHILVIGQTGAGKSYLLYILILQMLLKDKLWDLFICDPKSSGLLAIGNIINPDRTASATDEIISVLKALHEKFKERKSHFSNLVSDNIASSYSDHGLVPIVLIFDEFAAFQSSLKRKKKEVRDEVDEIIGNIIREGRQLGVFIVMGLQQANANNYSTEYREQMPIMVVLGNSGRQTYMTALGELPDNASRRFEAGQGLLTAPHVATAEHPDIIAVPTVKFEIGSAVREIVGSAAGTTDADD